MKLPLQGDFLSGTAINVGVKRCPSGLPFVSVVLTGPTADNVGTLCSPTTSCAPGFSCFNVMAVLSQMASMENIVNSLKATVSAALSD